MNQQQATALALYINRAMSIIPTTGTEWSTLSGALSTIEAVANGLVTVEVNPVEASPANEPEAIVEPEATAGVNPDSHEG